MDKTFTDEDEVKRWANTTKLERVFSNIVMVKNHTDSLFYYFAKAGERWKCVMQSVRPLPPEL